MAQTGLDLPKPKGLLPGGQSDSRFPVSLAAPVTEGLRLVIEYFTALNQRDVAGIATTLYFPFAIYENTKPLRYNNEAEFLPTQPPTQKATGSGTTQVSHHSSTRQQLVTAPRTCQECGWMRDAHCVGKKDNN